MKFRITIIDDDQNDIISIQTILNTFNEIKNDFMIDSITDPVNCTEFDSDIYILDIDMPGESGFSVSRRISEYNPAAKIIFCTSHNDLVFNAFELDTFYYVRKSDLKPDLQKAIRKYFRLIGMESYKFLKPLDIDTVRFNHIMYFESDGNYTIIHTTEHKREYRDRRTLKSINVSELPDCFEKISGSHIINFNYISSIENREIIMKDNSHIDLPRYKMNHVLSSWNKHLMKGM